MFCRNCGTQLNDGFVFCSNCGQKIAIVSVNNNLKHSKTKNKKLKQILPIVAVLLIIAIIVGGLCFKNYNVKDKYYTSKVITTHYRDGELSSKTVRTMNSSGLLIALSKYDDRGIISNVSYLYDENGKMIKMHVDNEDNSYNVVLNYTEDGKKYIGKGEKILDDKKMEWEYIYENDKKISHKIYVDDDLYESEYWQDKNVLVFESTTFGIRNKNVYEYDENNQLICFSSYSMRTVDNSTFELMDKTEYKYDKNGNCIETINYDENGNLQSKMVVEYNENEIPIKIEDYDENGEILMYSQIAQETDDKIVVTLYDRDGICMYRESVFSKGILISQRSYNENYELTSEKNYNEIGLAIEELSYDGGELSYETIYEYSQK